MGFEIRTVRTGPNSKMADLFDSYAKMRPAFDAANRALSDVSACGSKQRYLLREGLLLIVTIEE